MQRLWERFFLSEASKILWNWDGFLRFNVCHLHYICPDALDLWRGLASSRTVVAYVQSMFVVSSPIVSRWLAVAFVYGSGHSTYCVYGFVLVDVHVDDRITSVRYPDVADTKFWWITSFGNLNSLFEIVGLFRHTYDFPIRKEFCVRPVQILFRYFICSCQTGLWYATLSVFRVRLPCKCPRFLLKFSLCVIPLIWQDKWTHPAVLPWCSEAPFYVVGPYLRVYDDIRYFR